MKSKVCLIGLDGFDPTLLEKWESELPNITRMRREGAYCRIESTIPNITPTAWSSIITGVGPGNHGIYGFGIRHGKEYYESPVTAVDRKAKTILRILSDRGKKVISINFPVTYPPEEVNGIIISGRPVPGEESDFVRPKELKKEILKRGYKIYIGKKRGYPKEELWEEIKNTTEKQRRVINWLLEKEWDYFQFVLQAADVTGHLFWNYCDEKHPQFVESKFKDALLEIYKEFDKIVGEVLEKLPKNAYAIVLSDHGHGACIREVMINKWLADNGYLKFKEKEEKNLLKKLGIKKEGIRYLLEKIIGQGRTKGLYKWLEKNPLGKTLIKAAWALPSENVSISNVDWPNTKAFCRSQGLIYINTKKDFAQGTVGKKEKKEIIKQLKRELKELKFEGKPIVKEVLEKNEVYKGKFLDQAPDLIIKTSEEFEIPGLELEKKNTDSYFRLPERPGKHRLHGVFIAKGNGIKPATLLHKKKLIDLMPTILHLLREAIPENIDGKVMIEMFKEDSTLREKPKKGKKEELKEYKDEKVFTAQQERDIKERLKGLGYMG